MGARKRMGPATRAQDRLHSMRLRSERRLNKHNGKEDASMEDAPEVCETPTAPPREPTTPQHPPEQLRREIPMQAQHFPCNPPENQYPPTQPERDTPPTTPAHESPQSQLGLELQSHIAAAVASKTAQIKTTGDEVLELVSMVSQKVIDWEKQSLQGAASLGRDIRTLVLNFGKNLTTGDPSEQENYHPRTRHTTAMPKLLDPHITPPGHSPSYPRPQASHHNQRNLCAFFSASPRTTQPVKLARTPHWTY
ncbi:uncharacterized protein ACHE_50417A [Aspergillus chevalieri]|uniref:Uncharacterized protein n=1 Tax=Aspergillus chevalieri TaxID=182096 RepID=A0A7R7VR29_ASPCH|nr:uncharacterized protein ACHE_50417A [Aspergillus chevalieri]BCR89219.1 hypothetical protein ACHE_50417A [Aspergillus chevalieri]